MVDILVGNFSTNTIFIKFIMEEGKGKKFVEKTSC